MNSVLTLARLTVQEAIQKRVFIAALVVAGLFVLFTVLPMPIRTGFLTGDDMDTARDSMGKIWAWMGCGAIKFFSSVLAVSLSAGAISGEAERGLLSTIVPKPISRWSIYAGKWLGILTVIFSSVVVWAILLALGIFVQTNSFHPRIFIGVMSVFMFPMLFTTLTLFFSSFAAQSLSAGLALIAAGTALTEDFLLVLSGPYALNNPTLATMGHIVGYIVPLGMMNHWITRGLGSAGIDVSAFTSPRNPAMHSVGTSNGELAYILTYIVIFLAAGIFVFQKRDL